MMRVDTICAFHHQGWVFLVSLLGVIVNRRIQERAAYAQA